MARIAIDCDGVICNFVRGFNGILGQMYPGRVSIDYQPIKYDYAEVMTKAEFKSAFERAHQTQNFWLSLDAYSTELGILATWLIENYNQEIWITTSRSDTPGLTATHQTDLWLRSCGLYSVHNFLGVVTIPGSENKRQFYEAARIKWSIDDKPETVIDCGGIDTFEHHAYLLDRPWNREASVYNRVKSLDAFLRKIHA